MPIELHPHGIDGWILPLKVTPKASVSACMALPENATELPVKVTAPPDKGQANDAVIQVVAKAMGIPKSSVNLHHGETSRHKQVLVCGLAGPELQARICTVWQTHAEQLVLRPR